MPGFEIFGEEEKKEVMDVMETGVLMRYSFDVERKGVFKVRQFEQEFAAYYRASYALGVTTGSTALKVALEALDVGPGDEVIVPAFTFMATYEAVLEVGAIPVMADIDDTLNLDPEEINRKKTKYTKAVIPVHMCGAPAYIDGLIAPARHERVAAPRGQRPGLRRKLRRQEARHLRRHGDLQLRLLQDDDHRRGRDDRHGRQTPVRPRRLVPRPRP